MLAFTHIPETVDASFESILRRSYQLRHCGILVPKSRQPRPILSATELRRCRYLYPRLRSISGQAVVPYSDLRTAQPRIRFYTFLREPTQRCLAEYVRLVTKRSNSPQQTPFEVWIQSPLSRNRQCQQICGVADSITAIEALNRSVAFVGLLERFHESLVMFGRWTGNPRIDIRYHVQKQMCESSLQRRLLTDLQCRRLLIEANREDSRLYDFVCREVFPRQCENYGDRLANDVQTFEAFNVPPSRFPREVLSLVYREVAYRPLTRLLTASANPKGAPLLPASNSHRRRAA